MSTKIRITVLGSGTSSGIPTIGCNCKVCRSDNPKNKRYRASVMVETNGVCFVIDCGPDFRAQALVNNIDDLNAVVLTHAHSDHTAGIDDLRAYYMIKRHGITVYGDSSTLHDIRMRFAYCFVPPPKHTTVPQLQLSEINVDIPFKVFGHDGNYVEVLPLRVCHNCWEILGFRIGNFAYLTDVSFIPDETIEKLQGLDVMITTALRYKSHPSHMTIDEAVEFSKRVKAKQTYFTHMNHEIDHETTNKTLPTGIQLSYDGLVIELE